MIAKINQHTKVLFIDNECFISIVLSNSDPQLLSADV